VPKNVVELYILNNLYSTKEYSCVKTVSTLCISYFIEPNGDDEPHGHTYNL